MALVKDLETATNTRDVNTLMKHATSNIVMVSKNGEIVVGKTALSNYLNKMIGAVPSLKEMKTVNRSPRLLMVAPDMVIVDGQSDDYYAFSSGMSFSITTHWTATVVKQSGAWQIAALHFSFNLFDNPVLRAAQQAVYWAAVVAFVLGLLLSALCVFIKNRFKSNT